jgi:hypothetical protein
MCRGAFQCMNNIYRVLKSRRIFCKIFNNCVDYYLRVHIFYSSPNTQIKDKDKKKASPFLASILGRVMGEKIYSRN